MTGEAYDNVRDHHEGVATSSLEWPFPQGDVWIRALPGEQARQRRDGHSAAIRGERNPTSSGGAVDDHDVVVWWGPHSTHELATKPPGSFAHIIGPDLKRVKW